MSQTAQAAPADPSATAAPVATAAPAVPAKPPVARGYFNAFANGLNPWRLTDTHAAFNARDVSGIGEAFKEYGFVVVRQAFTEDESEEFHKVQNDFHGYGDEEIRKVMTGEIKPAVGGSPALNEPRYWPFIGNELFGRIAREVYGDDAKVTEIGSSAGSHYSARGLHRDLPTWYDIPETQMTLDGGEETSLRILMYPSKRGRVAGTFGVIPFSHRRDIYARKASEVGVERSFDWYDKHRDLINAVTNGEDGSAAEDLREMDSMIDWMQLDPGDVVLLDSRAQHSGDFITGPRYLFATTFVRETDYVRTKLLVRWKTSPSPHELEYYRYLNKFGLASDDLVAQAEKILG